jgi:hypothetical protein
VKTDEDGHFVFTGIEPGSYLVVAEKQGFADQFYGARRSGKSFMFEVTRGMPTEVSLRQRATVIKLEAGKSVENINISMSPTGVISGRVRDLDGRPVVGVHVEMIPDIHNTGGVRLVHPLENDVETDDRGEFRLLDAAPGRYYIVASAADGDEGRRYAKHTFYPGVIDFSRALSVDVTAGAEVRLRDIPLQRRPDAFTISGRLEDHRARPDDDFDLAVLSRHAGGMLFEDVGSVSNAPDGTFTAGGIFPGAYWVAAYDIDGDDVNVYGLAPFDVVGSNVQGVTVPLMDPISVTGRVTIDGKPPEDSGAVKQIRVGLELKEVPLAVFVFAASRSAKPEGDGTFSIRGLFPAEFRAFATDLPPDMYLKNIRFSGAEALHRPIALTGPNPDSLEIEIGAHGGQLLGVLLDDKGKPVSNAQAVLIPSGENPHPDLYRTAYSDASGRYWLRGIAPGDYTLLAWQRAESSYFDPQYIRNFIGRGKGIRVVEDSRQTVDVQVFPER